MTGDGRQDADASSGGRPERAGEWWRDAVIYQVYPRSFADSDGDGIGDLPGVRQRLDHLVALGVEAIWLSPFYPSPMADAGYDVADFRDVDPVFGTLADADALIADAHTRGIRVIVDVVPNHCSDAHPWFRAAVAAEPASPERARFWFRPGRGRDGAQPPNNWQSLFGGPAWTRVTDAAGQPGEWYLHLYDARQPDFNWNNPDVHAEFIDILQFWFDRGVDGVRIDSAVTLIKDDTLADAAPDGPGREAHFADREGVHEIYRAWRRLADSYTPPRALIGEVWMPDADRFARYLTPDVLHTAFNFDYLGCAWDAGALRAVIDRTTVTHAAVGAPATWVLSNHDTTRHVTRLGRRDTTFSEARRHVDPEVDLSVGTRRARAALLLTLALPGSVYLYQGEELGLWEVEDIPAHRREDPLFKRTGGKSPGRDGCRVPLPWSGDEPPFGFGPPGAKREPWLPQPPAWRAHTPEAQRADPLSMLGLYRTAVRMRHAEPDLRSERRPMRWLDSPRGVLAFQRGESTVCMVNLSPESVELPPGSSVLLSSRPIDDGMLGTDVAAWLRTAAAS